MGRNKEGNKNKEREKLTFRYSVKDIFCDKPHIEITDNTSATVEGSKGVLEYSDTVIRINLGNYTVAFSGRGMNLKCISPTSLVIEGFMTNIEFSV